MSKRTPPRFPSWLLERFTGNNQALIGDLLEEYRSGRTRLWYWRQTMIAASHTADRDFRSHPVLALRAFLVLLLFALAYNYCVTRPFAVLYGDVWWYLTWHLAPFFVDSVRSPWYSFLLFGVPNLLVPCIGYVAGGWLVARIHRPYQASFTLVNAVFIILVGSSQLVWSFAHAPLRFHNLPHSYWYIRALLLLLFAVSTLAGGLWKRRSAVNTTISVA